MACGGLIGAGRGRRARPLALLAAGSLLLTGCGLLASTKPLSPAAPLSLTVNSPVFSHHIIPARFTCYGDHGKDESPPIFWSGAPPAVTKSIVIVVDDSATPITPWAYWIVFDISPTHHRSAGRCAPAARQAGPEQQWQGRLHCAMSGWLAAQLPLHRVRIERVPRQDLAQPRPDTAGLVDHRSARHRPGNHDGQSMPERVASQ